jgi:pimeloyl-ACP methyl ester carboxylesterase
MDHKETRHDRAVTSRAPTVPQMRSRFGRKGGILVLALASILNIAKAQAGPCTAAIKQFELGIRRSATNPDAGPMAPQTIGAQLGHKLWFTDAGGTGTPIVLLHANTGTSASWEPQATAFAREGYRVIAFDRRGWGKSLADPATGPQPGSVAADLDALANHLQLDKFHLVGVAGGGFVSLDYAAWRAERLRSLVVAASTGQFAEKEMRDFSAGRNSRAAQTSCGIPRSRSFVPRRQSGGH